MFVQSNVGDENLDVTPYQVKCSVANSLVQILFTCIETSFHCSFHWLLALL